MISLKNMKIDIKLGIYIYNSELVKKIKKMYTNFTNNKKAFSMLEKMYGQFLPSPFFFFYKSNKLGVIIKRIYTKQTKIHFSSKNFTTSSLPNSLAKSRAVFSSLSVA